MGIVRVKAKTSSKVETISKAEAPSDLLTGLTQKKPDAKSFAFYLDVDVVKKLDRLAKQKNVSRSKTLNTILENYLSE